MILKDKQPAEDFLGRRKYAELIVKNVIDYVVNSNDSIVFGLNGPWGSGKSVLFEYIKEEIEKKLPNSNNSLTHIISFSPWQFSGNENIRKQFFLEIIYKLSSTKKTKDQIKNKTWMLRLPLNIWEKSKTGKTFISDKVIDALDSFLSKNESISKLKNDLEKIVIKKNLKLFIFLDDIDRLTMKEVIEIFQIISLQLNVRNIYFFLAYDKELIKNALSKEYGDFAEKYLEKVIQIDYSVPLILKEKLKEYFFKELEVVFKKQNIGYGLEEINDWWDYYGLSGYFENVRHVKIYINNLAFRLPHVKDEVHVPDFVVLEAIRTFDYNIYSLVYDVFLRYFTWIGTKEKEPTIKNKIDSIQHVYSKLLVKQLDKIYDRNSKNRYSTNASRRLTDNKYFEKYFSLDVPTTEVSDEEMRKFLKHADNRREILEHIFNYSRIESFLSKLANPNFDNLYSRPDIKIISDIIELRPNDDEFIYTYWLKLENAIDNILSLQDSKPSAVKFFVDYLIDSTSLNYTRIYILGSLCRQIKKNFSQIYQSHSKEILKQRVRILESFEKLIKDHKDWIMGGYLRLASVTNFKFYLFEFIAEYNESEYETLQKRHFEEPHLCIEYAKYCLVISDDGEPMRYYAERVTQLIPSKRNLTLLQNKLKELENDESYKNDQKYITYFLDIYRLS